MIMTIGCTQRKRVTFGERLGSLLVSFSCFHCTAYVGTLYMADTGEWKQMETFLHGFILICLYIQSKSVVCVCVAFKQINRVKKSTTTLHCTGFFITLIFSRNLEIVLYKIAGGNDDCESMKRESCVRLKTRGEYRNGEETEKKVNATGK